MVSDPHTYLVVWKEVVLVLNPWSTVKDFAPFAHVTVLPRMEEAVAMVKSINRPIVAFVAPEPAALKDTELVIELRRRSAKIFLIEQAAKESRETPKWDGVSIPFSDEGVQRLLRMC